MRLQRLAIILLVLGLIVGLEMALVNFFTGRGGDDASTPLPSASPVSEATPVPSEQAAIPTPGPTMPGFTSPPVGGSGSSSGGSSSSSSSGSSNSSSSSGSSSSSSSATRKPDPTAKPTNPPPPTDPPGSSVSSGSFSSNTGTNLNMSVSWEAREQGGSCRVYINGTVNSYSLQVASHPVSISFGGYSTSTMGKSLNVTGGSMTSSSLFSTYIDVPSGTSGTMTVSWHYNGTYSDVQIGDVTASGSVYTS